MDIRKLLNQSFKTEFQCDEIIQSNNKKEKRFRSAFTTDQIKYLEMQFKKSRYIGIVSRKEISKTLNISERAIKIWFQNRRMKEKNESKKECYHYDHTGSEKVKFNDQPVNLEVLKINNEPLHSSQPQTKPRTNSIDNFMKNNYKPVPNEVTNNTENERNSGDVITSPYPLTKDTTGDFSKELLKKCKNNLDSDSIKSSVRNLNVQSRKKVIGKCLPKETTKAHREVNQSSVPFMRTISEPQDQLTRTCTKMQTGYIPWHQQNGYRPTACISAGNILWKPLEGPEMTSFMPVRDFSIVPHSHAVPCSVSEKRNIQRSKCLCNCHMVSHQPNIAPFTHGNPIPHTQYLIAVPFNKNPLQLTHPVYKHC